jgi:uncharacterized membrane protein
MHGGSTHFPIALVLTSLLFDVLGCVWPSESRRRELYTAGYYLIVLGALSSFGAVLSGLAISKWVLIGTGLTARHHLFVWPSFGMMIALAVWRIAVRNNASHRAHVIYLLAMALTSVLLVTAGYWGGEMLIGN